MPGKSAKIPIREYYDLLARYLKPQWRRAWLLAALILGSIGIQLVNPQIMRFFVDTATHGGAERVLSLAAVAFILAALVQQAMSIAATYLGENVGWTATNALREDLARHCLNLDMSFHKTHTPGEMIERLDEDVTSLANFFSQFSIRMIGNLIIVGGVLFLLHREDWRVGLVMTGFVAVTLVILQIVRTIAVPHQREARRANAELSGYLEERLAGTEDIRANGAEAHALRGLFQYMQLRNRIQLHANLIGNGMQMATIGLYTAGQALALACGIVLVRAGRGSVGTVYLFIMYIDLIFRPIRQITRQMEEFQRAAAGIQRIQEIYQVRSQITDGDGPDLPAGPLALACRAVSFRYDQDDLEMALRDISFNLTPGQTLGLLGRTGSGKTTMTRLLARLYEPASGEILLGGVDLRATRVANLRRRVGLVTQDVQLFHATIRDNVTFFRRNYADDRIHAVFRELGLWPWYLTLTEGLETPLMTGDSGLSAGEAQLLALSRVFLQDPGLVLMDEASSRLDPATEGLLEQAVAKLLAGRTGIIVAHRLGTIQRVDQIMILEDGGIREYGPREKLARDPGSYFHHLLQTGLEEVLV